MSELGVQGALAGLRVIDLANSRGEMAGRVLADLGAEVICVEPPGGSASRRRPPFAADGAHSYWWETFALGKHSVVVDLDSASDVARLRKLVCGADVLIESFEPGYLRELGLDYASLADHAPGLIVASISPFGQDGPRANAPACELTIEAAGGLVGLQGDPDRAPLPVGMPQAHLHAGVQAAADILMALNARELDGRGQHLDVSMQAAMVWTLMNATCWPSVAGIDIPGFAAARATARPPAIPGMRPIRVLNCANGHAVVGLPIPGIGERTMAGVIEWLGDAHADLLDPDLPAIDWLSWMSQVRAGELEIDAFNRGYDAMALAFERTTKAELLTLATERKLLIAPVLDTADLLDDVQLEARDFWRNVGDLSFAGPFAKLSATPVEYRRPAPKLGAHQHLLDVSPSPKPRGSTQHARRALQDIKVADFAWAAAGPIISKALADHGADVIHVESSRRTDIIRLTPPFKDGQRGLNRSQFFANFNTNKRSIDLDLADPDDLSMAREIAGWADVVVESFVPGTMSRFGLDYETLRSLNPGLVMLSTCMRGQSGPQRTYTGFGNQGAALAGLFSITGWPDRAPTGPWGAYTDFIAPRYGAAAIAAALLHRRRTGEGQHIDLSQIEAGIHFLGPLPAQCAADGVTLQNPGMASHYAYPHGVYAAAGEQSWIALAATSQAEWSALAGLVGLMQHAGLDELARRGMADSIEASISSWVGAQSADAAVQACWDAGVPAYRVAWPSALYTDEQLAHVQFFRDLEHPEIGRVKYDGHATRFSRTPPSLDRPGPCLGQHSAEIRTMFRSAAAAG